MRQNADLENRDGREDHLSHFLLNAMAMEGTSVRKDISWYSYLRRSMSMDDDDVQEMEPILPTKQGSGFLTRLSLQSKKFIPFILGLGLICVLLWDMKEVQTLSEIIHDDHANLWEPMNETSLSQWYTPLDRCMLRIDSSTIDIKAYRQNNCSKAQAGNGVVHNKLFCGVGSSLGKICSPPLSTKSFFFSQLKGQGLGDPNNGYLKQALYKLARSSRSIIFLGDALSKQTQEAMICEMMRTDKRVWAQGNIYGLNVNATKGNDIISNVTLHWKDRGQNQRESHTTLDVYFLHLTHLTRSSSLFFSSNNAATDKNEDAGKPTSIWRERERRTRSRMLIPSSSPRNHSLFGTDGSSMTLETAKKEVNELIKLYKGVVIIANVGVWYNSREQLRKDVPEFLSWLDDVGSNRSNLVFFRETAAQHWNVTENGYFANSNSNVEAASQSCVPLADSTPTFDWRNRDVQQMIENEQLKNINILKFHDVTAPLYEMHPEADCTRYCYFPQMFQGLWKQLNTVIANATSL